MDCRSYESELDNRMKQTIRARRKRHFNAEHQHTRKNLSIWSFGLATLAALARRRGVTLSETVVQLIEDAERREVCESDVVVERRFEGDSR